MKTFKPKIPGFLIGIKIVIVNMLKTLSPFHSKPNVNYPFEKEKVAPRARGVIALDQEACTSCMLCARQCPDLCIYICLLYTSPSPRDLSTSRMPSSA